MMTVFYFFMCDPKGATKTKSTIIEKNIYEIFIFLILDYLFLGLVENMKCTLCNERNGNTRCEGCNTLFCLPCMTKHHDELAQQFQLLKDVRNEVKELLDSSRSASSSAKRIPCLTDIDDWESEMMRRIHEIAEKTRRNVNELVTKTYE